MTADSTSNYFVYQILNRINGKVYVGVTARTIEQRWQEHITEARSNIRHFALHQAILKYGIEAFELSILETCVNREQMYSRESFWIKSLNSKSPNGYNLNDGGIGGCCSPLTDEHKQKISRALFGRAVTPEFRQRMREIALNRPSEHLDKIRISNTGRKLSPDTKSKIREARASQIFTPEVIEKRSAQNRGRKHTDQARRNMSSAQQGRDINPEHRIKISKSLRELTDESAAIIKFNMWGWKGKGYAEHFGISPQVVCDIQNGRTYKDVMREHLLKDSSE